METAFNSTVHEYLIDGARVPSVTEVLPPLDYHCTSEQLEKYRTEGVEDHSKIMMYFDTRDTFGDPFLESFHAFMIEMNGLLGDLVAYERPLFSGKHLFAGRPDMEFTQALADYKRSFISERYHALQLAGYNLLRADNGLPKLKKWFIIWHDEGFKIRNVYNEHAEYIFTALLKKKKIEQAVDAYFKKL